MRGTAAILVNHSFKLRKDALIVHRGAVNGRREIHVTVTLVKMEVHVNKFMIKLSAHVKIVLAEIIAQI